MSDLAVAGTIPLDTHCLTELAGMIAAAHKHTETESQQNESHIIIFSAPRQQTIVK